MALTPDELRQRIPNWSLESDGQLLQYMISIAKTIEDKCSKTRDNLNNLMLQVSATEVKLANATNQFSAVEQVKFVENRVEEDDESFYGLRRRRQQVDEPRKNGKTEDGDERTMDDLIQLAVERSIEGMYKSYEKVTLQLTDSESSDEDDVPHTSTRLTDSAELTAGKATIMRTIPKYSFIERPLPHVIGSKEWQNKWHVGLIDSDDESSSDRKEEYSESPSETDDGGMFPSQPNSKNHTPSESESSIWGAEGRKRAPSMDPSITGDDGSSVYSYASSSKVPRTMPVAARGISSENTRLKPPRLFPEEPPEEIERRRADRGLFDDSPEEDEPTPMPTPQPRQAAAAKNDTTKSFFKGNTQQHSRKIVNLFDDEPPEPLAVPEQKKTINLFIESEDDEEQAKENMRNNNPTHTTEKRHVEEVLAKQTPRPALKNPRTMTKLVDELNNNFRKQHEPPAPEKTQTVPEDSSRHRSSLVSSHRTATNLFDDEPPVDEFDQLFNAANPTLKTAVRQTILPQPASKLEKEKKPINLFAEDDEDDYDGIVVGSNETRPQKSPSLGSYISSGRNILPKPAERLPTGKKKSIFDESDSEEGTNDADSVLFGSSTKKAPTVVQTIPKAAPKVTKSIFSDSSEAEDEDDEALFGKSSSILKDKLDALKKNGGTAVRSVNVSLSKPTSNPPSKSKSLFDDDSEDDESIAKKDGDMVGRVSRPAAPLALDKTAKTARIVSLFDDEPPSDDDDALFGQSTMKVEAHSDRVENTEKKVIPSNELEKTEPTVSNSVVNLFAKALPSDSIPQLSVDNVESKHAHSVVKEAPVTSNNSIRSLIMKKSIFNSDSEIEEDDSIFGTLAKSVENSSVTMTNPEASEEVCKSEMNHGKDASTIGAVQSIEQKTIVEEEPKSDDKEHGEVCSTDKENCIAHNNLESVNQMEKNEPSSNLQHRSPPTDEPEEIFVNHKKSIFDDSSSENEVNIDSVSRNSLTHQESDQILQSKVNDGKNSFVPILKSSANNRVAQENDSLSTRIEVEPSEVFPGETPTGVMISNDIDYYLHTNEPSQEPTPTLAAPITPPSVKSEPKSALNFSPIGLFDDVPPPDDGDETDDVTHPKQSVSVESTIPPIMDEVSAYSTETQSLNFISTGSAGGNRSRYLFDDEPPPDEADDCSAIPNSLGKSSAFKVGSAMVKGLFDNSAPASLPPMVDDSRTESNKPTRQKVNKLNTKLAINVAALLPGARRPSPVSTSPEKTVPSVSKDSLISEGTAKPAAPSSETPNSEKLTGLNKGRARIPIKRKPPSRQNLRAGSLGSSSLQSSLSEEERIEKYSPFSSSVDDRVVVGSEGKVEHIEAGLPQVSFPPENDSTVSSKVEVVKHTEEPFVDRLSASVRNPSKRVVLPDGYDGDKPSVVATAKKPSVKPSNKSIFGDSDSNGEGDDDFFSKLPSKGIVIKKDVPSAQEAMNRAGQHIVAAGSSRSIFGSDDEDNADGGEDDLFGTKKSSIAGQLKAKVLDGSVAQAVAKKGKQSLFDDDDDDEDNDDDLFGSKSKTTSKVNSHHQQTEQTKPTSRTVPTVTKPKTTTTRTADDPLADLLADS